MPDRFPGYDVLAKRHTPSWSEITRRVIDGRLALPRDPHFFTEDEWLTLTAVCARIVPQPQHRPPVPLAAMIDDKMANDRGDGYRNARLPNMQVAWRRGLHALDEEARGQHGVRFHTLSVAEQDDLLGKMQRGELTHAAWETMPPKLFFSERLAKDIVTAYYTHPTAWNEIGFGGPASPRGYVRMGAGRHDPWEAVEAGSGNEDEVLRKNRHVA